MRGEAPRATIAVDFSLDRARGYALFIHALSRVREKEREEGGRGRERERERKGNRRESETASDISECANERGVRIALLSDALEDNRDFFH